MSKQHRLDQACVHTHHDTEHPSAHRPHSHASAHHSQSGASACASAHDHGEHDACCASELAIAADASSHEHSGRSAEFFRLLLALLLAAVAEVIAFVQPESPAWQVGGMALAVVAIGLAGLGVLRKGLASLCRLDLNINALMSVAVTGAFLIGEWPEAAMVMALYSLAELIEHRSVDRARNAIKSLLDIAPPVAQRRSGSGAWEEVPAAAIKPGDVVRVKPGERLPLDGQVCEGRSTVDQSPVTGESLPVEKAPGDAVYAGTINQQGSLEFVVSAPASDTVLARIIHAVEQAQSSRAPTQRFIDRFSRIYTPAIFVLALALALGGPLLFGLAWLDAVYRALVVLVIACPCALVISTPVTVVSGLAAAARRGVLIKGGVYLEEARKLKVVALDKTGTLTVGRPALVAQEFFQTQLSEDHAGRIAVGLAARSDHPVSQAIAAGLAHEALAVEQFSALTGQGVQGLVQGVRYRLGSHRLIHEAGLCSPALEARLGEYEARGQSVSLLADDTRVLALFVVADTIRPASAQAVAQLKASGITPVILSGDNVATARSVAAQAGITEVHAGLLPHEKLQALRGLAQEGRKVAMVGDGINDAPALAAADIGFAMGGMGTHTAVEAADIVLMNDDLRRIPETIRLSRRTHAVLWQNILLALGIKAAVLGLAVFDQATMWMAVFADMGASLLVVFNGLRLLKSEAADTHPETHSVGLPR